VPGNRASGHGAEGGTNAARGLGQRPSCCAKGDVRSQHASTIRYSSWCRRWQDDTAGTIEQVRTTYAMFVKAETV